MKKDVFLPADILIPTAAEFENWSVIACDQFSSDKDYWKRVESKVEGKASTFHMIVPEAFLNGISMPEAAKVKNDNMREYLDKNIFIALPDSFVYVEREITGGKIRHGLVGMIDLDAYEYIPGNNALIRASENTVVDRLPPRISVRENAALELPHVMMLIDDPDRSIIEPLTEMKGNLNKIYDFDLMEDGGNLKGWQVNGEYAEKVTASLRAIEKPLPFVIGDGNHSLAAAKCCWENIKKETGCDDHPARYALVELNNVYDEGVEFEPIHRVVFDTDAEKLKKEFIAEFGGGEGWRVDCVYARDVEELNVSAENIGSLIDKLQHFLENFVNENGGSIDYIHDTEAVMNFAEKNDTLGILLPAMSKADLFETVAGYGVFPKKSFSIGHARDKRYYFECRKIK